MTTAPGRSSAQDAREPVTQFPGQVRRHAVGMIERRTRRQAPFQAQPELVNLLTGDTTAMLEAVFIGTHAGDFAGLPATGLQLRLPYSMAYDVVGGSITALRAYFPMTALRSRLTAAGRSVSAPA